MWNLWNYYNTMIMPNLQKDNSMISNINAPIIIYCHPHPLVRCLTEDRKKYGYAYSRPYKATVVLRFRTQGKTACQKKQC